MVLVVVLGMSHLQPATGELQLTLTPASEKRGKELSKTLNPGMSLFRLMLPYSHCIGQEEVL